jgi:hypothetical protein
VPVALALWQQKQPTSTRRERRHVVNDDTS